MTRSEENEFYIGWQPEAPVGISRRVRQFIWAMLVAVPLVGALLVLNQAGFANSRFEFGQLTELEGELMMSPAPFLRIGRGHDLQGQPVEQLVLLVGPGKHGAEDLLASEERRLSTGALDGAVVRLRGTLIFHDGKTLMEVESVVRISAHSGHALPSAKTLGGGAFVGEITDPKCLFGVMKPGYGKPHRACAARCIAGGIPPVLKTRSANGQVQHYLLAGPQGEPLPHDLLPFVGDQVVVCGTVKKMGDWLILQKDGRKPLVLAPSAFRAELPLCQ